MYKRKAKILMNLDTLFWCIDVKIFTVGNFYGRGEKKKRKTRELPLSVASSDKLCPLPASSAIFHVVSQSQALL